MRLVVFLCIFVCICSAGCVTSPSANTTGELDVPVTPVLQDDDVPVGLAQVTVLSDPPGAAILVDGMYVGKTAPDTVVLPFGRHTIEVECDHKKRVSQDVDVQGDTTVEMRVSHDKTVGRFLSKSDISKTGWAVIRASQQYVYISVNGKPANSVRYNLEGTAIRDTVETPYVVFGLKEGLVPIKVEAGGMNTDSGVGYNSGEFPIVPGLYSWLYFLVNGNDQMDILSVKSDAYAGYPYSVDGYLSAGQIAETREWPVSSNYVSVMTKDGYVSYQRDSMDRTLVIAEPRDVVWSAVSVSSSPSGADILVDGLPTGYTTPWTIQNVLDGFHKITVSKPGYLPSEK